MSDQIVTLLAVFVGALTSFAATTIGDRLRFRREQARLWTNKKLDVYADFLGSVKAANQVTRRVAAGRGMGKRVPALSGDDALTRLADAEARRASASEMVTLVGSAEVVAAVRTLNQEVRRLQWIAQGVLQADEATWEACNHAYVAALNAVHESIRRDLRIPGASSPREIRTPYVPDLPSVDETIPVPEDATVTEDQNVRRP
ncbi:hypothetical protein [Microbispora bryophytorum]|uniref:Secreted protein n=1 Tax=Microbispora bryophytorum subsp. camponoti TaxID=1677852 RepID=A0ABR8LI37_9ACTN|nr:hypothetical protein [Microbispora camponoti]MBD3148238.1 hypothetical protein [Microbispora camponoti]